MKLSYVLHLLLSRFIISVSSQDDNENDCDDGEVDEIEEEGKKDFCF